MLGNTGKVSIPNVICKCKKLISSYASNTLLLSEAEKWTLNFSALKPATLASDCRWLRLKNPSEYLDSKCLTDTTQKAKFNNNVNYKCLIVLTLINRFKNFDDQISLFLIACLRCIFIINKEKLIAQFENVFC